MNGKIVFLVFVLLFLLSAQLIALVGVKPTIVESGRAEHDPILIQDNLNFTLENGVTTGSGMPSDPYIIEGWRIDTNWTEGVSCITIRNTTAYFVIRNVSVSAHPYVDSSIVLYNVTNVKVLDSDISGWEGIVLINSFDIRISGNIIGEVRMARGIVLESSSRIIIVNNKISVRGPTGIRLVSSSHNTITKNDISSGGTCVSLSRDSTQNTITWNSFHGSSGILLDQYFSNFIFNFQELVLTIIVFTPIILILLVFLYRKRRRLTPGKGVGLTSPHTPNPIKSRRHFHF